jgi:2-polyprenyl-3-methyl-5-hydroxy-6-metoxy-1,4-benzoquinol methylase
MNSHQPARRELRWTPELVSRFWAEMPGLQNMREQYFTRVVGFEIANFLNQIFEIRGKRILDYGCGPGFLIEHLLRRGARMAGADYSPAALAEVNSRFSDQPGWDGAIQITEGRIDAPDASFDAITCIETIEHTFEDARQRLLADFQRGLKPGGHLIMTTPNEEDLSYHVVFCPNCELYFHKVQHMSSWTASSLSLLLRDGGFDVKFCKGIDLRRWAPFPSKSLMDLSAREAFRVLKRKIFYAYAKHADRFFPRPFPNGRDFQRRTVALYPIHLVAVGQKPVTAISGGMAE